VKIKKACLADIDKLSELNERLIEDEQHPNPLSRDQLARRMSEWLQGDYVCYLATENDVVTAYCLFRDDGEHYYLRQLYVERQHRRRGIATKFLDWMYANIWTDKKVRLDVLVHNKEAIAFYEAYGFRTGCLRMEK
jgi:ribosomal protein S18 acetylase RimI-like enzyme